MTKKHFIALADAIREHNRIHGNVDDTERLLQTQFSTVHLDTLADAFKRQNPNFNQARWLAYIAGECGPSGGAIKKEKAVV